MLTKKLTKKERGILEERRQMAVNMLDYADLQINKAKSAVGENSVAYRKALEHKLNLEAIISDCNAQLS
jgi:hypothetical protein